MWLFLRDSFISVVQHDSEPRLLHVRARLRGDIERVFPEAIVAESGADDYRFTAAVGRERVAQVLALKVGQIKYNELSEAVEEEARGAAYDQAYAVMLDEQTRRYGSELDLPHLVPHYDLQADPELGHGPTYVIPPDLGEQMDD